MLRFFCALIVALALTSSAAVAEEHLAWLRFGALQANQTVRLSTADGAYRVRLLDPRSGEARVTHAADGQHFGKPQRVFLVGATMAPQPDDGGFGLVLMGELHEGMCIEWGWGSLAPEARRTTAPLTGIILETPPATEGSEAQGVGSRLRGERFRSARTHSRNRLPTPSSSMWRVLRLV